MTVESIRCLTCDQPFAPRTSGGKRQTRCSAQCRRKAATAALYQRKAQAKASTCDQCGGPVQQLGRGRPRRFCSSKCKDKANHRKLARGRRPVPKPPERRCVHCGKTFQPKRRDSTYCYAGWCVQAAYQARRAAGAPKRTGPHPVVCDGCGQAFVGVHPRARWCSKRCRTLAKTRANNRRLRRSDGGDYTDRQIFERDAWHCYLCDQAIDPGLVWPHDDCATIDHVVPIATGGTDDPNNVRAAHWRCNRAKGQRAA